MKKILKVLTLVLMVAALTGCVKLNINMEVKSDKTMKTGMEMLVEESLIQMSGMTNEEYLNQMKEQILSNDSMKDAKTTPIDKTIDGSKWVGIQVEGVSTAEETKNLLTEKDIDGKQCIVLTLPMDDLASQMDAESMNAYGYSVSKMKASGVEMNLVVEMPADATTNMGKAEGNKVTVDLLELMSSGKTENLVISSPLSSGMDTTIVFIVIGLVVIGGAVFFILKKKKKPTENVYEQTPATEAAVNPSEDTTTEDDKQSTPEVSQSEDTQKYCPNCGTPVSDEETCPNCGYTLKK